MILASSVSKLYDDIQAVNDVSLSVEAGQTLGLIGPNGAGKTTLLRMLATLSKPDTGRIEVLGYDTGRDPREVRRRMGFMPAEFGVPRDLTMREYMRYFACLAGLAKSDQDRAIDQALELTELQGRDEVTVGSLSTGNKQRLLLAKTLIHDPEVLILDEPSSGLDPRARVEVREILQTLASLGKTIVISSHILADLESICSHVVIMEAGRAVVTGNVQGLKEQLKSPEREVQLRVPEAQVEKAKAVLETLEHVMRCEVMDDALRVASREENCNYLLRALLDAEIEVLGLEGQASDLESIFIQTTKGEVT